MNAQQMAMLQQAQQMQMQQMQMQGMQGMQGMQYPNMQPAYNTAYPTPGAPAPAPYAATPYAPAGGPAHSTITAKAIKLPDGVSIISLGVTEITCRGPTGGFITLQPAPKKPDFEKEENVKPIPYAAAKSGHCHKMGFKKTLGMARWNKRTLKVEENRVDWNVKEHKGIILNSFTTLEKVESHSPKRRDAHEISGMSALSTPMFATHVGEVGKDFSIGIHCVPDPMENLKKMQNGLQDLATKSPMQMMMSPSKIMQTDKEITHYFHFDSATERDEWYNLIANNLEAAKSKNHVPYQYYIGLATQAGVANAASFNWRAILTELYAGY